MSFPLVSILIPCYNAEKWIAECIQSALNQTYPNKEVIVVDDGSTDGSLEIIKSFGERIRWETGPNRGGNVARNRLLELSRGEWLQYLDADDYLLPDKIQGVVAHIQTCPGVEIIYGPIMVRDHLLRDGKEYLSEWLGVGDVYIDFIRWSPFGTGGLFLRKKTVVDVGGWKADQPVCQEHELLLRLIIAGKNIFSYNKIGYVYRYWSLTCTSRKSKKQTVEQRILLTEKMERFLKNKELLTDKRLSAVNFSRLECARNIYAEDKDSAVEIEAKIKESCNHYMPPLSGATPFMYRIFYKLCGFRVTEELAIATRGLRRRVSSASI